MEIAAPQFSRRREEILLLQMTADEEFLYKAKEAHHTNEFKASRTFEMKELLLVSKGLAYDEDYAALMSEGRELLHMW